MFTTFCIVLFLFGLYNHTTAQNDDSSECECVPFYLCNTSDINKDGTGLIDIRIKPVIDIRFKPDECPSYLDTCCPKENIDPYPDIRSNPHQKSCGFSNPDGVGFRITGDSDNEAQFGEFPWMVALFQKDQRTYKHIYKCGGSLIHPRVVLTAAHCVDTSDKYKVRVGEWDSQTTNEILKHQDVNVKEIICHPNYNAINLNNDISLLFLELDVFLNNHVNVACLPPQGFVPSGNECFVMGWGRSQFGKVGVYQTILKKIGLPVMNRKSCQRAFRRTRLGPGFILHSSFMCAGGEEGKDACTGDGGGPLVCQIYGEEERYEQVGIVAWGIGCGQEGVPGAYVDVAKYRKWIDGKLRQRNLNDTVYEY